MEISIFSYAQEGINVPKDASIYAKFVSVEEIDRKARLQYAQILKKAASQNALAPDEHPQVQRLRRIAKDLIAFSFDWNPQAKRWSWEVNLLGSTQINAFCMPGGKIALYSGILTRLQLTDDEVAIVIGHEIAHALLEHARSRIAKSAAVDGGGLIGSLLISIITGMNAQFVDVVAEQSSTLLTLKFSRDDEIEADLVGMEIAARAGYDPRAGVTLWKKMSALNKKSPPQWFSTHPTTAMRIEEIEVNLPKVIFLYEKSIQHR
jgi:predicted Zn-dependent protease